MVVLRFSVREGNQPGHDREKWTLGIERNEMKNEKEIFLVFFFSFFLQK